MFTPDFDVIPRTVPKNPFAPPEPFDVPQQVNIEID